MSDEAIEHIHPPEDSPGRPAVAAWVVYDMGNTLFFVGIMGVLFPLWITGERGRDDATVGFTVAAAMALMLVIGPAVGAFSDQVGRRKPFLAASTLTIIAATMLLGGQNVTVALSLYALAIIGVSAATIFYNALITDVSTEETRGTISGMGVGVGYLGAILAVSIGLIFVESQGHAFAFRAVAVLLLLVSLPLFLLLRERPRATESLPVTARVERTWVQLRTTLGNIGQFPGLLPFLVARFWYTWAVNTASAFAVLYGTETVGFSERKVELVLVVGILVAIPSAFLWGRIADRLGPGRVLRGILLGWMASFAVVLAIAWLDLPSDLWWIVGVGSGILVSGIWVVDRPYLLLLTSPKYVGEVFGLHSMTSRLSAVVGPFSWGFVSITLGFGQTAAVMVLAGCIVISYVVMRGIGEKTEALSTEPEP